MGEVRMHLKISTRQSGDVTILDLDGRVTIGLDCDSLNAQFQALTQKGVKKVLVNLIHVSQLDSTGISSLVRAFITMQHSDGAFKLLNPSGRVREVLDLTRLNRTIPTFEDETEAISSFSSAKPASK
jgi:anti-sigma B factor antagonist